MADIAKHIRIFNASPDDDFVTKRIAAISAIEIVIKKKITTNDIFELSNGLVSALENCNQPNDVVNSVSVAALKKSSTSFVADDESLQIITCTLLAILQYLEKIKTYTQKPSAEFILAVALWNGLTFQKPIIDKERLEALRLEVLEVATKIATNVSDTSRLRKETKPRVIMVSPTDSTWKSYIENLEGSYGKLVDAIRINSILDREELDILWWTLGGWSNICEIKISALNPVQKCLVSSLEIGKLLRRFPSKSHTFLACRETSADEEFTVSEIVEQLGDQIAKIVGVVNTPDTTKFEKIFPLCYLLANSEDGKSNNIKRPLYEWTSRLLVEVSLNNINTFVE